MKTFLKAQTAKRRQVLLLVFLLLLLHRTNAQSVLDGYIKEGLENNIVLREKNINLEKALWTLKEANGLFLPSVNFNGNYISGRGGRYIALPLGDLMNPVYQTLNSMTGSDKFPNISNTEAYFNPHNYYDGHVRTTLPIVNTDIYYNKQIQKEQTRLQEYEVMAYKRELVKNIKQAYYNYLMALSGTKIYESALVLLNRNIEVNQSLLKNGKGLPASVLRSQSEAEKIRSELMNAQNQTSNAQKYFNFLLNKSLDAAISTDFDATQSLKDANAYLQNTGTEKREEVYMVKSSVALYHSQLRMSRSFWVPKVNSFLDLGSQGLNWTYNNKSRYYLFGLQMDVPIFNGFKNSSRIARANLDKKAAELHVTYVSQQVQMGAEIARNGLETAMQDYQTSLKQLQSAQSYFRLMDNSYREGASSLIEYIDARNQLTSSELKVNLTTYKVLQAMAQAERETATYSFTNNF